MKLQAKINLPNHLALGKLGERLALEYLLAREYSIIKTNFSTKRGEIDIIVKHKSEIAFVEVKTRRDAFFQLPWQAVNFNKQKKIINCANDFLEYSNIELDARFDVISILITKGGTKIQHIKNAFHP